MANRRESGRAMMSRDTGASCAFARMLRTGRLKPVIINVEGDSDINFYRWLTDCHVELNQNNGKKAALEAVATAISTNKKGVVAIVDSDFDHILQIGPDRNVFRTDTHDIETMMLREDFLRISDPNLRDKKKSNNLSYDDIWSIIISIGKKIGKLRLISTEKKWNLDFKEAERQLESDEIITLKKGQIVFDFDKYINYCVPYYTGRNEKIRSIKDIIEKDKREFDTWQICRGHDLSLITSIVYSKNMYGQRNVSRSEIENLIHSNYILTRKIKKTDLYRDIKDWQIENCEWKILNDDLQ